MRYLLFLFLAIAASAQQLVTVSPSSPFGNGCGAGDPQFGVYAGIPWSCQSGHVAVAGSGLTSTVTAYGAIADKVQRTDGVCNGTTAFTSALGTWSSADSGKYLEAVGCLDANGNTWHGTFTYVSSTQVTLSSAAGASLTGVKYAYGTPAQIAFQNCVDGVGAYGTCLVPAPTSCPTNAVCGYIFNVTDQMTAHAPGSVKIRFPGISLIGTGGRVHISCSGWPALYTGSVSQGGPPALIRGNCIGIGDQDGPLGTAGEIIPNITVNNLALDGMTNGNTFQGSFTPSAATCSTTLDCWDITHKGISMPYGASGQFNMNFDNNSGHFFKGEEFFGGGDAGSMTVTNSDFGDGNADGMSVSSTDLKVLHSKFSNLWNAGIENGVFADTVRQLYDGNEFSNMYGQGLVLPGDNTTANIGPILITNNTFQQVSSQGSGKNGSTSNAAVYVVAQSGTCSPSTCVAPGNILMNGNACMDCYIGVYPLTPGHMEISNNSFGVNGAALYNIFQLYNPLSNIVIKDNTGYLTAAAVSGGFSYVTPYVFNPGFGTLTWTGLRINGNAYDFTGSSATAASTFITSSGSGFSAVTSKYPIFANESCLACTYPDVDHGQQNLAISATVEPAGPEVHVFDASPVTATIDCGKMQDGATVKIVNTGSTTVTFTADSNLALDASVALTANESEIFRAQASLSKCVAVSH